MDTFDPQYDMSMSSLIFPEHNKNKFIYGQMVFVLDED